MNATYGEGTRGKGMGMKTPSGDLLFYAVVLLCGAIYLTIRLPTTAAEYQVVAVALIVCVVARLYCSSSGSAGPRSCLSPSPYSSSGGAWSKAWRTASPVLGSA